MECFILAGGQSRRFGEDKLLYKIGARRTINYVIDTAKEVCSKVYVVTKEREKFKDVDAHIIEDLLPDQSPIIGLYTALKETGTDRIMILSGDIPLIKPEVLKVLIKEFREPVTVFSIKGKVHPLIGIYSRGLLPLLEDYLKLGRRSVMGFLEGINYSLLTEKDIYEEDPELRSFLNMNTKEDLEKVLEIMG